MDGQMGITQLDLEFPPMSLGVLSFYLSKEQSHRWIWFSHIFTLQRRISWEVSCRHGHCTRYPS